MIQGAFPAIRIASGCLLQWAACLLATKLGLSPSAGFALASCAGLWHFRPSQELSSWAKAMRAGMFPASYCALWASVWLPSWTWGLCFLAGLLVYPRLDASTAPLWRSPKELGLSLGMALSTMDFKPGTALDAGCGLGDGVLAMRTAIPDAQVDGMESAWLPWIIAMLRCGKGISRIDMWSASWSEYDLVYLFLRPEAMPRAKEKCARELRPEAIVACLDFPIPDSLPLLVFEPKEGRQVRLYKAGELNQGHSLMPDRTADQGATFEEDSRALAVSMDKQTKLA